jgi:hypothetical protein
VAAEGWCVFGADGKRPLDQRPDGGHSLAFEGAPLSERGEVLGAPRLEVERSADARVAPYGTALRVSSVLLN